jgi:archaellum component FlaG (FlaF/FlaG flagellin family)
MTDTEIVMTIVTIILLVYAGILSHILYKIVGAMITESDKKKKNSLF